MVPWLGAGELLNLAAGWAPEDAGTGSSSPFPGVCAFPAYCAFRGERAVFAGGFALSLNEPWQVLYCAFRARPAC